MKSAYVKPTMMFEGFQPTEYVAACYKIQCKGYMLYDDGTSHDCKGGEFILKDGKHGNYDPNTSDNDTLSYNEIKNGVVQKGYGSFIAVFLAALEALANDTWDSFWAGFNDKTERYFIHQSHPTQTQTYDAYSNWS